MWYQTDRFIPRESAVQAGVKRDLQPRLDWIYDWIDSQLAPGAGTISSATRSRPPTSSASC